MGVVARKGLVQALRSRISDDRATVTAFSLSVTGQCKSALLELTNGFLTVTVEGGENVKSLRFNLNSPKYNTIGRLLREISRETGYKCLEDQKYRASTDHPSIDLRIETGIAELSNGEAQTLRHFIFSDEELMEYLSEAISLHNPNYTINTVPPAEQPYVLMLAASRTYRTLAGDSARRRGLDTDAEVFLSLARREDDSYKEHGRRQMRIIPSTRIDESKVGTGDAIMGSLSRRSLRAGYTNPYRSKIPNDPPVLLDPADDDLEDTQIRLRWNQDRDESHSYYELWRDTQANVERSVSGRLETRYTGQTVQQSQNTPFLPINTQFNRGSSSIQILGLAVGANRLSPVFDGFFFWTAAELAGSNIVNTSFYDGIVHPNPGQGSLSVLGEPLEPDTDYYYRLYSIDWNGEVQQSNVLHVRTKNLRARFARDAAKNLATNAISPIVGPIAGGTTITVNGTNFTSGIRVTLGPKPVTNLTVVSPTQITFDTPGMTNEDFAGVPMDLVIQSPNGLRDIAKQAFRYEL